MINIQKIHGFTVEINFNSPRSEFNCYWQSFLCSELGKVYQTIPWHELIRALKIKASRKGPACIFTPLGTLALMFLKSYVGCSDNKLVEYLNGNIDFQQFYWIFLGTDRITNYKIVSEIRCKLSAKLKIKEHQKNTGSLLEALFAPCQHHADRCHLL